MIKPSELQEGGRIEITDGTSTIEIACEYGCVLIAARAQAAPPEEGIAIGHGEYGDPELADQIHAGWVEKIENGNAGRHPAAWPGTRINTYDPYKGLVETLEAIPHAQRPTT